MDWVSTRKRLWELLKEYRYVALVIGLGVLLMLLPGGKREKPEPVTTAQPTEPASLQQELENILCLVSGAGKVRVLLTQSAGEQILYQQDEEDDSQSIRRDTVILSDSDRTQSGLVSQVLPPKYLGAIILCQGAESASVRLAILEAVAKATGLSADKISVLKMK